MSDELADREDGALKHLYKPSTLPPEVAKYEPPVDLDKLLDGLTLDVYKRQALTESRQPQQAVLIQ